jgi:hypothetical protein
MAHDRLSKAWKIGTLRMDLSSTVDISMFQKMMTFDKILSNNTMITLPQDIQDNGRPTKLFLENSGGPKCLSLSITMSMVVPPAKPPKYTLGHVFHYNLTKYPLVSGNP